MSPYKQARAIYRLIKNDPVAIREKRNQFSQLASSITGTDGGMQITDANVNGQNFSAKHSSTDSEKLDVLSILINMLDCGGAGSTTVIGRFL